MAGVREEFSWSKKYFVTMARIWNVVPRRLSSYLVTMAVIAFGVTVRGEWVIVAVHVLRQLGVLQGQANHEEFLPSQEVSWRNISVPYIRLQNFHWFWIVSNVIGFMMYFCIGGFLHWYWYVRQRDRPELWKCQTKWMSVELEKQEIMYGSRSLLVVNTTTSLLSCYIANGGWSTIYYQFDQYSWAWYFLQWPIIFIYQDYSTYLLHRLYHTPWLYKKFHKAHHKYLQPTAFSVTAIHPFEIVHTQLMAYCMPLFVFPTHWTSFTSIAIYTYYHGIMDHSGIDFKAPWWQPWRPDTIFHDNHHQYFHVNFGFNCFIWDKLHGTYRRTDRIYKEDIFYGKGKPLTEASAQELHEEERQRREENPKAHRHLNPSIDQVETTHKLSQAIKGS